MVLYHWSQSTRLSREGALGPLSFIYERQYTEQLVDNQQEQKTVNLAELKHSPFAESYKKRPIALHLHLFNALCEY